MKKVIRDTKRRLDYLIGMFRWIVIAILTGIIVGDISTLFGKAMNFVTGLREENDFVVFMLPVLGLIIVWIYRVCKFEDNKGTNIVIMKINSNEEIPKRLAPLIFISTILSHLGGASVGREGAALQIGGGIGNMVGHIIKLSVEERKIIVMCGMSAAFAALFGTPMAAAVFAMEVGSVGMMQLSAIVPCVFSAVVASQISQFFGLHAEVFEIAMIPQISVKSVIVLVLISAVCGIVSSIFCITLHKMADFLKKLFTNSYVRILVVSIVIIAVSKLFGTTDYLGAGMQVIERAVKGEVVWYAFGLKMILTALSLGAGFKGGEIVPTFFIGATLGCLLGQICDISPSFGAAIGMISVFCGATNCPLASVFISFEMFGSEGAVYYMMAAAISYVISEYHSLYGEQTIVYSKITPEYINQKMK